MVSTNTKLAEALRKGRGLLPDASLMSDDELAWDLEAAAVLAEFDAAKGEAMNNDPDWLNNQSFRDQAAYEALAAHDAEQAQAAKAVPAGFVLVPVEPTLEMLTAAGREDDKAFIDGMPHGATAADTWAAMLAAAPTPPAPEAPPYRMTAGEVDAMNRALTRSVRFVDEAQAAPEAQQTAGQEQDERDAFEAWATEYSTIPLERDDDDGLGTTGYTVMEQTMRWDAWQAAMAHASAAVEAVAVQMPRPASWSGAVTPERVEQMLADYRAAVLRALGGK